MNQARPFEPPMPEPLAFFLTWPTYGSWLPGDERGWVEYRGGWKPPDPTLKKAATARMTEDACVLTHEQRIIAEQTIRDHCVIRGWELFAVSCRSNHVHVVVAANIPPKEVCRQFKSWCTRRLKEHQASSDSRTSKPRQNWWAERASKRFLNDEASLESAVIYTSEAQDRKDRDH